jgi:hypothetical protein
MRRSSNQLPKNSNRLAAKIVQLSTEELPEAHAISLSAYFSQIGRTGGLKGGKARAKKLSPRKRKEIAQKAAKARWKRKPKRD